MFACGPFDRVAKHCGYTLIEMFGYSFEGITGVFTPFGIFDASPFDLHMELLRGLGVRRDRPGHAGARPSPAGLQRAGSD